MAVPDRNRTLFRCAHYCVQSTVTQYFRYGWDSYTLCQLTNTWYVCTAHMSPTLNGSSVLQLFERSYTIEIHNRMFDFYPRLPHLNLQGVHITIRQISCVLAIGLMSTENKQICIRIFSCYMAPSSFSGCHTEWSYAQWPDDWPR